MKPDLFILKDYEVHFMGVQKIISQYTFKLKIAIIKNPEPFARDFFLYDKVV